MTNSDPPEITPGLPEPADRQLSEIVVKYRALCTAQERYLSLRREVAKAFAELSPAQQQAYVRACERIDNEARETR